MASLSWGLFALIIMMSICAYCVSEPSDFLPYNPEYVDEENVISTTPPCENNVSKELDEMLMFLES